MMQQPKQHSGQGIPTGQEEKRKTVSDGEEGIEQEGLQREEKRAVTGFWNEDFGKPSFWDIGQSKSMAR